MAYTKVKPVRNNLSRCLDYTANPQKTERFSKADLAKVLDYTQNTDKTEHQLYVTGFNCDPANACKSMTQTKQRWNKDRGKHILAYHLIQSFKPGEVTPEQAFEIGCEFARRYLADKYEVTVSTHLDRAHLHCHIVFNSVSFVDGTMFTNTFDDYYNGIRKISDDLCREYKLSVIDSAHKGKSYAEKQAEEQGRPTVRGQIRQDVDLAISKAVSWQTFVLNLQRMGYVVRCGPNVKYATVRHKQGKKAIRLKSLGDGYSEEEIKKRIAQNEVDFTSAPNLVSPVRRRTARYRGSFPILPKQKVTGFMALYYHYLYLFRKSSKRGYSAKRTQYLLRDDLVKFDRYIVQANFIWTHHIESADQLEQIKAGAEQKIHELTGERDQLYRKRKHQAERADNVDINEKIRILTEELRTQRKAVSVCSEIQENISHIRQQLVKEQQQEIEIRKQEERKERMKHEHRR